MTAGNCNDARAVAWPADVWSGPAATPVPLYRWKSSLQSASKPVMKAHAGPAAPSCVGWLQRMFENGNTIPVYSPLVDRLGLGPRLVGRLGFSSTG